MPRFAFAADMPAIGTWPAGSAGSSVSIGIAVPLTGSYAAAGADELKGWQLAVEHLNSGDALIRGMSPKTKKGVLGKTVELVYAEFRGEAEPGSAGPGQVHQRRQGRADERLDVERGRGRDQPFRATRTRPLFLRHFRFQLHTTGKDCVRYGFRQNFYGQTAAAALGPVLIKAFGKNRKAAYMTPDYTYGHTVTKAMNESDQPGRLDHGDQPGIAARRAGLQQLRHQYRQHRRRVPDQRELGP